MGLCGTGPLPLHRGQQHPFGLLGRRTVGGVLAQQRGDHRFQRASAPGRRRLLGDDGLHGGDRRRTAEGRGPLDRRVERGAQRPQVGRGAGIAAAHPLGGQVVDGADQFTCPGDGRVALDRRDPEVRQQHPPVPGEQHVGRFDVTVQHTGGVRGPQGAQDMETDPRRLAGLDLAGLLGGVGERRAVDVLHDDPGAVVVLDDVVDGDDSRVGDPGGRARLLLRAGVQHHTVRLGGVQAGGQLLDGHRPVEDLVMGSPHLAHTAAAQDVAQPVPPGQYDLRVRSLRVFHVCPRPVPRDDRLRRGGRRTEPRTAHEMAL